MKQREPVVNQNGRSEAVSGCLRRSAEQVGVPCQGEGRGFESRRPRRMNPPLSRGFCRFEWLQLSDESGAVAWPLSERHGATWINR